MKQWLDRMRGRLRMAAQIMPLRIRFYPFAEGWKELVSGIAAIWKRISPHRSWIWAFTVIGIFLLGSQYLFDQIDAHYQRHPPAPGQLRIDHLSFWDRDSEGARNLVFAIGGWLGVLAAIVGFIFSGFRTSTQLQMTQTAIDGQVTERFTKAVEQLGHEKRAVRLGAIYALERIAKDSPRDRDTIVETLAAYIRELAPWPPRNEKGHTYNKDDLEMEEIVLEQNPLILLRPPIDIAAALTVICRLLPNGDPMRRKVDLRHTDLRGLDAPGIDLSQMRLDHANLSLAQLGEANLSRARLNGADLRGATLRAAILSESNLSRADLQEANLSGASLFGASLVGAELSDADLGNIKNLTQEQINGIRYFHEFPPINIPIGLTLPEPYDL